jgi:hypothetical protein
VRFEKLSSIFPGLILVKIIGKSRIGVFIYPKNIPLEIPNTRGSEIFNP